MEKVGHKLLIDPKFIEYMNRLPPDEDRGLLLTLTQVVHAVDKKISSIEPDGMNDNLNESQPAFKVMPPVNEPPKTIDSDFLKRFVHEVASKMDGFAESEDCKGLLALANGHNNPVGRRFTDYKLFKVMIPIHLCLIDIPKGNKIVEEIGSIGAEAHYTFGFNTNDDYTGEFPIDLPMISPNMAHFKH